MVIPLEKVKSCIAMRFIDTVFFNQIFGERRRRGVPVVIPERRCVSRTKLSSLGILLIAA